MEVQDRPHAGNDTPEWRIRIRTAARDPSDGFYEALEAAGWSAGGTRATEASAGMSQLALHTHQLKLLAKLTEGLGISVL